MTGQVHDLRDLLKASVGSGFLSPPHPLGLPAALPFRAAVVTAALPAGCAAPEGPIPLRVGSGVGPDEDTAALLALAEAAERYALQYAPGRPTHLDPMWTAGGKPDAAMIQDLTLGAPERSGATSQGAAAGVRFEEAADRALLEVLEHQHVGENGQLSGDFVECNPGDFSEVLSLQAFLEDQLRTLELAVHISPFGYIAVRALCRDRDGGRPTMGSAAGKDVGGTARRAAEEAILLWRNMIEIERHGRPLGALEGKQNQKIRVYRGAEQLRLETLDRAPSACRGIAADEVCLARYRAHCDRSTGACVRCHDGRNGDSGCAGPFGLALPCEPSECRWEDL